MFEFREPLLLLAIIPSVFFFWIMTRPTGRIRFSSLSIWPRKIRSFKSRTSFIPPLLITAAYILICIALAGPRIAGGVIHHHKEGISMMLVVDKSGSMAALDMAKEKKEDIKASDDVQDRLEALKDVLSDFIKGNGDTLKGRPDDSIGLISFAAFPDSDCPLTLDHVTLMQLVKDVEMATNDESSTSIGDALALATERLREAPTKSKVIILLTDGANNSGYEDPIDAARMAAQFGIKVYTIGIGTNGFAPVRVMNPFTNRPTIQQYPVELDEETLKQIADITDGAYFRATDRQGLERIYEQIDAMEKTKISENRSTHYDEKYAIFLIIGLILAGIGIVLRMTYYRRMP